MRDQKGLDPLARAAFGCLAVLVLLAVTFAAWLVIFVWDVNLPE